MIVKKSKQNIIDIVIEYIKNNYDRVKVNSVREVQLDITIDDVTIDLYYCSMLPFDIGWTVSLDINTVDDNGGNIDIRYTSGHSLDKDDYIKVKEFLKEFNDGYIVDEICQQEDFIVNKLRGGINERL